jgi:hypothetical protein
MLGNKKFLVGVLGSLILLSACRKGDIEASKAPETKISVESINLEGDDRLRSRVRLSWFGTDVDGYIKGYELSFDNVNWDFTTTQDSVFLFDLPVGQTTADIDFYVRAIDNTDLVDPTPAYLKVPIKNTPPTVNFLNDRGPQDTAYSAATFFWTSFDDDGLSSINKVQLRFNDGDWFDIQTNQNLISFLLDTSVTTGQTTAELYYNTQISPEAIQVNGVNANGNNELYIRAIDIAGAESAIDTTTNFYFKNKTPGVSTLWINGHAQSIASVYKNYLDTNNISYDALNYGINQGERQPFYWNPTFRLALGLYKKVFINASPAAYTNPISGETNTLLRSIAPSIQTYTNAGGKVLVTTSFGSTDEVDVLAGPFPIEGLVTASGQARISNDSSLVAEPAYSQFPDLQPRTIQFGVVPIIASADAVSLYRAQLIRIGAWTGDNLMATGRVKNNKLSEVFIAVELHNYNKNNANVASLVSKILKDEF